ncbi:hypothetical protein COS61_00515 [Candidatus Wolfebacteria bacterium CG03_land_8_20_14_0_80_40_12]|uniref:LexA repressor DNA-binding domain-containing protein n=1 Tax=Candidatus Wolfebacteria bacterium CG03_land_8_20_14_0_80_40_12 TaxID=1975069 RepID=A0A2M7B6D0_9BACT|nr:MAG: hypothetical protein COS61_00515 [Candidatus Wolfebacteria bacterium CG03_land_8_20_14_0_80_40_12]
MPNLHPLQEKIYNIYRENNSQLPTFRDLAKTLGVSSTNTVAYHIQRLKKAGLLQPFFGPNGVLKLTLANLLSFKSKSGIYVFLKNNQPFYVGESENIKNDLWKIINAQNRISEEIKNSPDKIDIAYQFMENAPERQELKNYLIEFYQKQNIAILSFD